MKNLFINNRQRFAQAMDKNAIAIFASNQEITANGDTLYPFKQNSNILWLCGISQPNTFVIIHKDLRGTSKEFLFIKEPNPLKEIWDGKFLTPKQAQDLSGIPNILFSPQLDDFLQNTLHHTPTIYLDSNENDRKNGFFPSADYQLIQKLQTQFPLHAFKRSAAILKYLRAIKNKHEIALIQKAIDITSNTFKHLLQFIKPGIHEFDIQAEMISSFLKQRSSGFAFNPILASGDNARILHYTANDQPCKNNDLILMDFGASFNHYNADITRTIPINGSFSKRQKEVYNACLHLNTFAQNLLKPGILLSQYTSLVGKEASNTFLKIGLLSSQDIKNEDPQNPAYRQFLYHGISHHLGIDVHDLADKNLPLKEGMVLTVEPGIYIQKEQIGIRLENNILISKQKPINLSKNIPILPDDIQKAMQKK